MFKPTHSILAGLTACLWLPLSGQEAQAIYNTISPNIQKCLFADFTGDGTEDMMQYADNTFYLITATEPGEWQLERSFPAPGPAFLSLWTTADINNDGFTDMICKQTNDAFWFCAFLINPGTADGEWTYMVDDHYMRYLIGFLDADSDGDVDMLYEDTGSSLHWVENDAGVFTIEHTMPDYYPATILSTIADFDQDGDMDLVIYFDDEGTYYYTNDGDGSFTVAELNSVEFEHGLWSGDFNNDGYADVIFQQGGHLQIAEFEPYTNSFNDAFDWIDMDPPDHFDVADLNGDGMKDWIFGFHDVFGYHVFYNLNNGIFFNPGDLEELPVFIEATPFYLMHDMQGDGKVDLVIHDSGYTYAYASAGAFLNQKQDVFDAHLPVELVSVFDVDGDDDMDIIALDEEGRFILMKYDIAGDVFNEIFVYPDVPDTPEPLYLTHADLDNDGDEDALAGFDYGDSFAGYYFLNNGSGSFTAFYFTDVSLQKIWFSDVDSDGDLDMLGIEREPENTIVLYQNSGETGALFSDPTTLLPPDPSYKNFSVDDENLDGLDDILFSKSGNTALYIMYNTGVAGYFNAPESLLTLICPGVNLLYTADIDNDMDLDILYTCPGGVTKISRNTDGVYINEAAGDFYGNLMDTPDYSDILDLNNDGTPDLIYGNDHINGGMYFKMSNGIGTYNADFIHYTGDHGQCVDQDGNGTIDFIGCSTAGVYTMRDIQSIAYGYTLIPPVSTILVEDGYRDSIGFSMQSIPQDTMEVIFTPGPRIDIGNGPGVPKTICFQPDFTALITQYVILQIPDNAIAEDTTTNTVTVTGGAGWGIYTDAVDEIFSWQIYDNDLALFSNDTSYIILEGDAPTTEHVRINMLTNMPFTMTITADARIDLGNGAGVPLIQTFDAGNAGMNGMDLSFQYVDDPYNIDNYPSVLHFDLALADTTLDVMTFDPISVYMHDDDTSGYDYYYFDAVYGEGLDSFSMSLHFISPPSSDLAVQVLPDEQLDLGAGKGNAIEILLPQSETAPDDVIISGIPAVDRNTEGLHYGYVHFIFLSDDPKYSDTTGFQELIQITDSRVVDLMRDDAEVLHIQNTTDGTYIITGLDQEHTYAVEVFTLSGALLFSGIGSNSNSYAIESVAWSPGMYMVRLTDTDSNAIKTGRILFH